MSKVRLRTPLLGALITALISVIVFLGGAASADAKDNAARTANNQEQLLDPQAPVGTEAKSSKAAKPRPQSTHRSRPKPQIPTAHLT